MGIFLEKFHDKLIGHVHEVVIVDLKDIPEDDRLSRFEEAELQARLALERRLILSKIVIDKVQPMADFIKKQPNILREFEVVNSLIYFGLLSKDEIDKLC